MSNSELRLVGKLEEISVAQDGQQTALESVLTSYLYSIREEMEETLKYLNTGLPGRQR